MITPNPNIPSQVVKGIKFPQFMNTLGIIPTSYKDSMTYYECLAWLCKFLEETVIPTVNENGEATEELQNLFVQLNEYITNYFDNLDVQNEINNKLDEMSRNGTLTNLLKIVVDDKIEEKIQPQITIQTNSINSVREDVNQLNARVNQITNLPSGSTSGDAELADIRIAYDGITYTNAGDSVRTQISNIHDIFNNDFLNNNVIKCNGVIRNGYFKKIEHEVGTSTSFKYMKIKVQKGEIYRFKSTLSQLNTTLLAFIGTNDTFLRNVFPQTQNTTVNYDVIVSIPAGVEYVYFTGYNVPSNEFAFYKIDNNNYDYEIIIPENIEKNKYIDLSGTIVNYNNFNFVKIPVLPNEVYLCDYIVYGQQIADYVLLKSNSEFLSLGNERPLSFETGTYHNKMIIIPNDSEVGYLVLNYNVTRGDCLIRKQKKYSPVNYFNNLNNKLMGALGDSKTHGDQGDNPGTITDFPWTYYIPYYTNIKQCINYGLSGTTISSYYRASQSFVNRYSSMNNDLDIICVYGGVNDFIQNVPLGNESSIDNNTFYGALENLINGLLNKYPNKFIFFITPMKQDKYQRTGYNNLGLSLEDYVNVIKNVCDKYSIPILDFYKYGGISPYNDSQKNALMPDGLHENNAGYKRTAQRISAFIKTLL